jgi:hypothetical protein
LIGVKNGVHYPTQFHAGERSCCPVDSGETGKRLGIDLWPAEMVSRLPSTIVGRATMCTLTNAFGASRTEPCVAVEDGRQQQGGY